MYPVRKVQEYVLPRSHDDLGYTDLQANVEEKQMLVLAVVIFSRIQSDLAHTHYGNRCFPSFVSNNFVREDRSNVR